MLRSLVSRHGSVRTLLIASIVAPLLAAAGVYAADPIRQCQSGKNKAAGTYATCRQSAEAKLASSSDAAKYATAIGKCEAKLASAWAKLEAKAADKGAVCLDGASTEPQFKAVIDGHTSNVADALKGDGLVRCGNSVRDGIEACDGSDFGGQDCTSFGYGGGSLICTNACALDTSACQPIVCGNGAIDVGEQCDQNDLNGATCTGLGFSFGTLSCGAACILDTTGCYSPPRLGDNGDGTITDHETGLMWEKKADLDNVPVACASALACPDPHDADNRYTWTDNTNPTASPTGTAFTAFLAQLNAGGGFAGHADWRLPTLAELHALVDYADATSPLVAAAFDTGCTGFCAITSCSCTVADRLWSDSSLASTPSDAWIVDFGNGEITRDTKDTAYAVRAVRTGL